MLRLAAVLAGMLGCAVALHAQTPDKPAPAEAPQLRGVYATIEVAKSREMERRLKSDAERRAAIREVLKQPGSYTPPVLYALANALSADRPEDAIFWYHVGRLRVVYDALRCRDKSVRKVIPQLGRGLSIELRRSQYYYRERVLEIARKAIEWDASNPRDYDQRWIALLGEVAAVSPGADAGEVQRSKSRWPGILKHVHDAHLKSVEDFAAQSVPTR